jgi:hypothetical protein
MPANGVPEDVTTEGVSVIIDVPCGVPVTCCDGMLCGAALVPPPPHPAIPNRQAEAMIATLAAHNKCCTKLGRRTRDM